MVSTPESMRMTRFPAMLMTGKHKQVFSHSLQGMSYTVLVEYPNVVKSKVSGGFRSWGACGRVFFKSLCTYSLTKLEKDMARESKARR